MPSALSTRSEAHRVVEQVGLLDEVEIGVGAPIGIGETLVARIGGRHRLRLLALHPLQGLGPQGDETRGELGLRMDGAFGIGHPVLGHLAKRLDHLGGLVREAARRPALLEGPHVGGRRLAGLLDEAGGVARQGLEIRKLGMGVARAWPGAIGARRCRGTAVLGPILGPGAVACTATFGSTSFGGATLGAAGAALGARGLRAGRGRSPSRPGRGGASRILGSSCRAWRVVPIFDILTP